MSKCILSFSFYFWKTYISVYRQRSLEDTDINFEIKSEKIGNLNINAYVIILLISSSYAVIKKETPPKAAVRRKRSTKSLGAKDKQFATLPLMPRRSDHELAPPRPPRNYSTISHDKPLKPDKPPRRKSASSLVEISK